MGKTIANYTDDIKLIEGQLIITTSVAPLKQELIYQREKYATASMNYSMNMRLRKSLLSNGSPVVPRFANSQQQLQLSPWAITNSSLNSLIFFSDYRHRLSGGD